MKFSDMNNNRGKNSSDPVYRSRWTWSHQHQHQHIDAPPVTSVYPRHGCPRCVLRSGDYHRCDIGMEILYCVGNWDESFKSARNVDVKAPMDFAIVTGWQVSSFCSTCPDRIYRIIIWVGHHKINVPLSNRWPSRPCFSMSAIILFVL